MFKSAKLAVAVGFLALLSEVCGRCNECSAKSKVACLTETTFDVCINGNGTNLVRSGIIGSCKGGQVCTSEEGICKDKIEADCGSMCNDCVGSFACVSQTEFALCSNNKTTLTVMKCPGKKVCDISSPGICAECTSEPTCTNAEYKKPDPAVDYADTCVGKPTGYYRNIYDTTCRTYVFCQDYSGKMNSILYTCPQYFDVEGLRCVTKKPSGCS